MPSLDIVIVNWNSRTQLHECLASIAGANKTTVSLQHVVVVDNSSSDGSADNLDDLNLPLSLLRNATNQGFAVACNQGAASSRSDYLLFLNPDTRLLPHALEKPIGFMEQPGNDTIGIVGVQLTDENGHVAHTCTRFPKPGLLLAQMLGLHYLFPQRRLSHFMTDWDHADSRAVDHVMAAYWLLRRSVFEALKGFDERFFVYLEDLDFSLRARRAGWRSFYLADVQAYHRSGGTSEQIKARRLYYSLCSRIHYAYKHFPWWTATGLTLVSLLVEPFSRMVLAAARGNLTAIAETLLAYGLLWQALLGVAIRSVAKTLRMTSHEREAAP